MSYRTISDQLGLHRNTVNSFCKKYTLLKDLPPAVKRYRGKIQGRKELEIKNYIHDHPMTTQFEMVKALGLEVSQQTLSRYLRHHHIMKKPERKGILVSIKNRELLE
jgi:transposase